VQTIQSLQRYLFELSNTYDATICIKDFTGFMRQDKAIFQALSPFENHTSAYCNYVKSNKKCYRECLDMIPKILRKCTETRSTFSGFCHAGSFEYVIPIMDGENILGAITFGGYASNSPPKNKNHHALAERHPELDESLLEQLYLKEPALPDEQHISVVLRSLEFIASYLGSLGNGYCATENTAKLLTQPKQKQEDVLVEHALTYIKMHVTEKICIEDIARYCNYSSSYVSRNFNKVVGMNINTYINKLKVEVSKTYLITSNKTIADIAEIVGFEDLSYYSRVFSSFLGIPPAEFRRRFT
jgi:AraC-like DNA-binding protein